MAIGITVTKGAKDDIVSKFLGAPAIPSEWENDFSESSDRTSRRDHSGQLIFGECNFHKRHRNRSDRCKTHYHRNF